MVMGYICQTHGFMWEKEKIKNGLRTCPKCGEAVTSVNGKTVDTYRAPPEDEDYHGGNIRWDVATDQGPLTVEAYSIKEAVNRAIQQVEDPQSIRRLEPENENYRAY